MMKGILKKALGVVAAAALAVTGAAALTGTANAAVQTACGADGAACTVTLSGSAAQISGHTFKYVKVASYDVYGASPNETLTLVTNPDIYNKVVSAVESATGETVPTNENTGKKIDPLAWAQQQNPAKLDQSETRPWFGTDGTTRQFADGLRDSLSENELVAAGDDVLSVSSPDDNGNVTATFTFTSPGLYLILDQNAVESKPADEENPAVAGSTKAVPILVGTALTVNEGTANAIPYSDGSAEMKNDVPTIGKTVKNQIVQEGENAEYTLTTNIPNYIGYKVNTYQFKIADRFEDGAPLTYVPGTLAVTVHPVGSETATTLTEGVDFTVTGFNEDSKTFTIDLSSYIRNHAGPEIVADNSTFDDVSLVDAEVTVTYSAKVTGSTGGDGALNTPGIEYSNDPTTNTTGEVPGPGQKVFNFDYAIQKIDRATGDALQGATFAIYKKGSNSFLQKCTTDEDGIARFYGLDGSEEGVTYTIKEIAAPEGYVNVGLKFDVTIKASIGGQNESAYIDSVTYEVTGDTWNLVSDGDSAMVTVENVKSITQLPMTGAAGITLFAVLGLLIAGVGVMVYMKSRSVRNAMRA